MNQDIYRHPIASYSGNLLLNPPVSKELRHTGVKTESKFPKTKIVSSPSPALYLLIFGIWIGALIWFQPRMIQLLEMANSIGGYLALLSFILFIDLAWLYGIYNLSVVAFAAIYQVRERLGMNKNIQDLGVMIDFPEIALLYTTCNDFIEKSALSCVKQDYPNYTVYLLDDSKDPEYMLKVDNFASQFPGLVKVVRRPDRKAFKAGNLNHALKNVANKEKYFAIADADEILPEDFLSKLVPLMEADPKMGFVQANHRANPESPSRLAKSLGVGIDIHWKWYQPLRNKFGFVMFLGHGALLRRKCWVEAGGFPDIVSEDLGFAIHIREKGYRGYFAENVICFEDFPDTVRSFRIRHMKWTRGTCEFLKEKTTWLLKSKNITWTEKLDIFFPTLNLPLTLIYFIFMVDANIILPWIFGTVQTMTIEAGSFAFSIPVVTFADGFSVIYTWDFFLITVLTFFSPVLCFVIAMAHKPIKLFNFLSHSTALYAALSPLSSIGVIAYMISGKAIFLVTGDKKQGSEMSGKSTMKIWEKFRLGLGNFLAKSHPDYKSVQILELGTGLLFAVICVLMFQISFFGLCAAFILLPIMHYLGWNNRIVRVLVYVPFIMIILGMGLATLNLFGMQSVFFGYGFHF